MTATAIADRPRTSALERPIAMRLAATEYQRYLDVLRSLASQDWNRSTDCPDWDVRAMATHVLGMAEMAASIRENRRQTRAAMRRGGVFVHSLTALQVAERATMRPDEIVHRFAEVAPRAARGRRRTPGFIRRRQMPVTQPVGDADEPWTLGFLIDTILTRDTWMHRVDTTRATSRSMHLTGDHDGVLVADVVGEWSERHGQSCTLHLTGPAGGRWSFGQDGPGLDLDAVEFCRIVSHRAPAQGLLRVEVPF
jgi:uncharacterized protein (TIGR03083 family)